MVEVFDTNIKSTQESNEIKSLILSKFPAYIINFDLEDCDKILRIESQSEIASKEVIILISKLGISVKILEDIVIPKRSDIF